VSGERACEVCGSRSHDPLYDVDGFPIVRCRACGLVFVGRIPKPEELVALYDSSYWDDPEQVGYDGYLGAEARKRHHFRTLLSEIEALAAPGRLLEVGSAYGYFLDEARRRGWQVRGVEPSSHAARQAREAFGLDVDERPLAELPPEPAPLDAVVLWDVIEHLPDPRRTLESAHARLRPGGVVGVSTGDVESLSARLHGQHWSLMTPPWHQFYFSRKTLRELLEQVGFEIERIGGDGVVALDPATSHPRVPRPVAAVLQNRLVKSVARRTGAGMTMFVFARKAAP
jgi:SAM-dependent methyltransferase